MAVNGLQASGTIEADQEFTIANTRGVFHTTASATITTNAATIYFFPALPSTVANATVITFKQSTLTPQLEPIFCHYVAGIASINKPNTMFAQINTAITTATAAATAIGTMAAKTAQAITDIGSGRTEGAKVAAVITAASAEIDLMNTQVDLGVTALASGNSIINTVPVGSGAPEYMSQAQSDFAAARGFMSSARGYLDEANAEGQINSVYLQSAARQLQAANTDANEAISNLRLVASRIQIAQAANTIVTWGRQEKAEAINELRRLRGVIISTSYSRG